MRMILPRSGLAAAILVLGGASGAPAQTATDACATFKWSIAREQKAFAVTPLTTVKSGETLPAEGGVTVALEPQASVAYPQPPGRAPKSNPAYGAVLTAPPITTAGTYQATLSDEAWIDLVQNGTKVHEDAYSGKKGCPGIRKSVRFKLGPGPLTIEINDSAQPSINLALLPAE
jgi:hypothetical protein